MFYQGTDVVSGPYDEAGDNPFNHLDDNHAALWALARRPCFRRACDLASRMSPFMDWSDVALSRRDRDQVRAGLPVSPRAMILSAEAYVDFGGSFYDPDRLLDVLIRRRIEEREAANGRRR